MALLSAKNKRMLNKFFYLFGIVVMGVILFRAFFKSGAQSMKEKAMTAWAGIKDAVIPVVTLLIVSGVTLLVNSYLQVDGVLLAVAIGTLTTGAGVVTTLQTTYVPKEFFYVAGTQLTGVKITVQGDGVIFDSDAAGLNHAGTNRVYGQVTNGFLIQIANGFIAGKNVIWEFTNSAAQTPVIYVSSDQTPPDGEKLYLQLLRQAILANSGQDFKKFATLSLPSLGATDVVNVLYQDGTQQQLNRADIQYQLARVQNIVNTPIYLIDNYAMNVKKVNVIGAAQTAYVQRWVPSVPDAMISQVINN